MQSSVMALMASAEEIRPMPRAAIFADTGNEPQSVYSWLRWLEPRLAFPLLVVRCKQTLAEGSLRMRVTRDGRKFSSTDIPFFTRNADGSQGKITSRGCTRDYKIAPILRAARQLACIKRGQKTAGVVQWIGISVDEVVRMKPSRERWAENRWPLIEAGMTRHDCLRWMERRGLPKPPRSACVFCPYHNDHEWRRLKTEEPDEFARAIEFERRLQEVKGASDNFESVPFLHRSLVPLAEVDFSTDDERGQGLLNLNFGNECFGMCGV